ncbi:uncharacterized protein M6B38_289305 [Iris pallida]|uniref:Uncharacterized protein n=1 Tax=Iris pallida TaxID=29817 RepID=A0AAX6EJF0_IRIPA|nr:uncharacterized protein M6B38_187350 [Iris pallida]KAJ6845228.1 uncharacterized protein M6B38_289305 [Iris pallida]
MRTPVPPHSGAALTCLRPLHRATGRSSAPPDLRPPRARRASPVGAARIPDPFDLRLAPDLGHAPPATAVDEASGENPRSHRPPQSTKPPTKTLEATTAMPSSAACARPRCEAPLPTTSARRPARNRSTAPPVAIALVSSLYLLFTL